MYPLVIVIGDIMDGALLPENLLLRDHSGEYQ